MSTARSCALSVKDLSLTMDGATILSDISFELLPGEMMAVVGPSGSGKSSLLNAIAGFIRPSAGVIEIGGQTVSAMDHAIPPERRNIGMVFQSHALWPQLRVVDNVAFPLRRQGKNKLEAREMAETTLASIGMQDLMHRFPEQLSGGQQQRVGLARALVSNRALYLFDEPTASLDAINRQAFAQEAKQRQKRAGIACLYVTHHIQEAFEIADKVLVLIDGRIQQIGTPVDIYERPNSPEVAELCGKFSICPGVIDAMLEPGTYRVSMADYPVALRIDAPAWRGDKAGNLQSGDHVRLLSRPEWCTLGEDGVPSRVEAVRYQGVMTEYQVHTRLGHVYAREMGAPRFSVGDTVLWQAVRATVVGGWRTHNSTI